MFRLLLYDKLSISEAVAIKKEGIIVSWLTCLTKFWSDRNWSQLSKLAGGYGFSQVWKMSPVVFELDHKVYNGLAIWGFAVLEKIRWKLANVAHGYHDFT